MTGHTAVDRITIVGGGAAGLAIAETVRSEGFAGELVMVAGEPYLPYDRPPLSKQVLTGTWDESKVQLRDAAHLDSLDLTLLQGVPAAGLDTDSREVLLADGTAVPYDVLGVATGVKPRMIPGCDDLDGVHVLRDLEHAIGLRGHLVADARLVIIGAGVLGCEVAAVARGLGVHVTVVDQLPKPMSRVVGPEISNLIAQVHDENLVRFETGIGVAGVKGNRGRVDSVVLSDGRSIPADVVLVAIGSDPTVEWLRKSEVVSLGGRSPADGAGGVLCSPVGAAADQIFAAGDVAAWWTPELQCFRRVEHRMNAGEQGEIVGKTIMGAHVDHLSTAPYFWSDQYNMKIQYYGLPEEGDEFCIVDGSLDERKFVGVHIRENKVVAVVGISRPRPLRAWRTKIGMLFREALAG